MPKTPRNNTHGNINDNPDEEALAKSIFAATTNQEVYDLMKSYLTHLPLDERIIALSKVVAQMTSVMRAVIRRGQEEGIDVLHTARVIHDRERFDEITRDVEL